MTEHHPPTTHNTTPNTTTNPKPARNKIKQPPHTTAHQEKWSAEGCDTVAAKTRVTGVAYRPGVG